MSRRLRIDPYLVLLLLLSLPVLAPLFAPGYFYDAHDGRHSVFYLIQFDASLRDGALWPRWAMHHIQGYGYPTFLIQAPLGFYLGEIFVLLGAGFTLAAKLSWAVGVLAGAWGMYALVKDLARGDGKGEWSIANRQLAIVNEDAPGAPTFTIHNSQFTIHNSLLSLAAVAAGLLYTYFPYHIADMYVRGALNDALLLAWLPWLFLVFNRLLRGGNEAGWPRRLGLAMLVLAGTLLTHTFALLSIVPLLATFILFRLGQSWMNQGMPWRQALLAAAGGAGGLLLCTAFLAPLLVEGSYLQQQVYVTDTYDFRNHFVQVGQFLSPFWGFGYSDDPAGANDGMSFQLGALLVILGIVAVFVIPKATRSRGIMAYLLAVGAALLLVMTPLAQPLWEAIPPLGVIQFPWRLLALAGFVFSALGGCVVLNLVEAPFQSPQPAGGLIVVALLGVFAGWPYIQANLAPVEPWREDGRAIFRFEQEHPDMIAYTQWVTQPFTTTAMTADYASPDYAEDHGRTESLTRLEVVEGEGEVLSRYSRGSSAGGVVSMASAGTVQVNVFYFPGWAATIDGAPAPIAPSSTGAILVEVPAGEHRIDARFGDTPVRTAGAVVSAAMLAVAVGLVAWPQRRRR